jgi:hypothetical protein
MVKVSTMTVIMVIHHCHCRVAKSKIQNPSLCISAYVEISNGAETKCRSAKSFTYCSEDHLLATAERLSFRRGC